MTPATFGTKASKAGMYVQLNIANTANHWAGIQKDTNHYSNIKEKLQISKYDKSGIFTCQGIIHANNISWICWGNEAGSIPKFPLIVKSSQPRKAIIVILGIHSSRGFTNITNIS